MDATTGDLAVSIAEVWKTWEALRQKVVICSVTEMYDTADSHGIQTENELYLSMGRLLLLFEGF